jgi:hypothetical protein
MTAVPTARIAAISVSGSGLRDASTIRQRRARRTMLPAAGDLGLLLPLRRDT